MKSKWTIILIGILATVALGGTVWASVRVVKSVDIISDPQPQPVVTDSMVTSTVDGCTEDALVCPDGTVVGRTGPECEFVCPENRDKTSVIFDSIINFNPGDHRIRLHSQGMDVDCLFSMPTSDRDVSCSERNFDLLITGNSNRPEIEITGYPTADAFAIEWTYTDVSGITHVTATETSCDMGTNHLVTFKWDVPPLGTDETNALVCHQI